jgi:hypothetical protein
MLRRSSLTASTEAAIQNKSGRSGTHRGEFFPSPIFAVIFSPGINSQCRCSGCVALPAARIGEGDGCGISAGAKPASVHREGVGNCGRDSARSEGGVEPTRNPRDQIMNAAARGTQLISERRGREDLPLGARGRDVGRRRDLQRRRRWRNDAYAGGDRPHQDRGPLAKINHMRKETELDTPKVMRFVIGNPLLMKELTKHVPDAGSYAPVTILVDERPDGVH